jgi:N-ethylmaleimide reductase
MKLLTPVAFGDLQLPNRILHAPLTRTRTTEANIPNALMASYYAQRASSGLLIAEATMVAGGTQAWFNQPSIESDAHVAGWKLVTDAVHAASGRIILQIWHPGRATHESVSGAEVVSSTDRAIPALKIHSQAGKVPYEAPRRLRDDELPGIVAMFKDAAVRAKAAGFDGVQIHGAHGYLIDQFLRDGTNDRTDAYGGSVENRAKLMFEVIDAASDVFGAGRVGVRISPVIEANGTTDSNPTALVAYVAQEVAKRALSHLELRHGKPEDAAEVACVQAARAHIPAGSATALVLNGGFTRDSGEATLANGLADAIAYGTAYLANPDLPERFAAGAPLNAPDSKKFYSPGEAGYTDYPAMAETALA